MFYFFLALLLGGILYLIDKSMKGGLVSWLKYGIIALIVVLAFIDIYMTWEIQRWIDVCKYETTGHCKGLTYTYTFLNASNVSVSHTTSAYGEYSNNTGALMAYTYADRWVTEDIIGLLPFIAIFITALLGIQSVYNVYHTAQYGKENEK